MKRRRRARTPKQNAGQGRVECPATVVVLYRLEEDKDGVHLVICNAATWCMQPKQNPSCEHDPAAQLKKLLIAQFQAGKAAATMRAKHDYCSLHL